MTTPRGATGTRRFAGSRMHRSGPDAQRVLLVGDRDLVEGDADSELLPLPAQVADGIASRTERGLDLDLVWDLGPALQAVAAATQAWRLWRYDVVVVLVRDAQLQDAGWWRGGRITRLAHRVLPELAEASRVLVVRFHEPADGPPSDGEYTGGLVSTITLALNERAAAGSLPLGAEEIADRVVHLLHAARDRAARGGGRTALERRDQPQPEPDRQRAVDRTMDALGGITPHLERVVLMARNTFDVPCAQVNLLDHGRIRTLAYVGGSSDGAEQPICTITVRGSGPVIIADTWDDHRLDRNPHVHGTEHPVRFYAAHPIESSDGYRIGTLCVFDTEPHDLDDVDPTVLRDLALLAEAEISTLPDD